MAEKAIPGRERSPPCNNSPPPERVGGAGAGGGCIRPGAEKLLVWHDELFDGVVGWVLGLEGDGLFHFKGLLSELPVTVVNWPRPETNVHLDVLKAERD